MVTREFAERNHLMVNSKIPLVTISGKKEFTVRGIMSPAGMAQAFGGNLAVMDIYAAQQELGRGRRFDRIDVRAKDGITVDRCQAALQAALGPGFQVDPPSARGRHFEALLQSYSTAMTISSLFALLGRNVHHLQLVRHRGNAPKGRDRNSARTWGVARPDPAVVSPRKYCCGNFWDLIVGGDSGHRRGIGDRNIHQRYL